MLYPGIDPYDHGMLDVGDGQRIYWEVSGHPDGLPVVVLHGGPGSGSSPGSRRFFDPSRYRIVLFDQRQCGRSTPHASDADVDLSVNTTGHLVADLEHLRHHLEVDRWLIFGTSWGSTLGLVYAQEHPDRVTAMVLAGVTMTRRSEIDWLYRDIAPLFPEQWVRFRQGAAVEPQDRDLVAAYYRHLANPDPAVREKAAADWHDWEAVSVSIDPDAARPSRWSDPAYRMARARIVTHYFHHAAWLEDNILLKRADKLSAIPGQLIQGRLDLMAPLVTAWELAKAWPNARLVVVPRAGHSTADVGIAEAIVAATDDFADRLT
ncbi:prolyl aminopeptidase [Bauldia sp.]|uniref:prolyl aminopeptidase n=1 Tax=Bauldia sp. TaxID=2575872 RepID=UPI003BAB101F